MRALILGVTGQDGSYLAEHLVGLGHEVFGMVRRPRAVVVDGVRPLMGDLLDLDSLKAVLAQARPDVVYNLAAVTAPGAGWGAVQPPLLTEVTGNGVLRLLDALDVMAPEARLVHASSSAVFDLARYGPYGVAKQLAHEAVVGYRGRLHACNAVLYSHTSPRQDPRFLAPTIVRTVASGRTLRLGDVNARRDWGYAPDYVKALVAIARQDQPGDWTVATGTQHSVWELVEAAMSCAGRDWWQDIEVDPDAPRVADEIPPHLPCPPGWEPETGFVEMVEDLWRSAIHMRPSRN